MRGDIRVRVLVVEIFVTEVVMSVWVVLVVLVVVVIGRHAPSGGDPGMIAHIQGTMLELQEDIFSRFNNTAECLMPSAVSQ